MLLEVQGLHKAYGAIVVAEDLGFSLDAGECLGVIGPNGAGKSSLFNLLTGMSAPTRGSIVLGGRQLVGLPPHARARLGVARAFQVPQPFASLTVFENALAAAVLSGRRTAAEAPDAAAAALAQCGLSSKAETPAGRLPLLDRKRLEMARALASDPQLLLLDEVAGGLTEREVALLVELVRELKQRLAIVWIEHIAHALRAVCDRVLVLHFGRKLIEDLPERVMDSRIVREGYMGVPGGDEHDGAAAAA